MFVLRFLLLIWLHVCYLRLRLVFGSSVNLHGALMVDLVACNLFKVAICLVRLSVFMEPSWFWRFIVFNVGLLGFHCEKLAVCIAGSLPRFPLLLMWFAEVDRTVFCPERQRAKLSFACRWL